METKKSYQSLLKQARREPFSDNSKYLMVRQSLISNEEKIFLKAHDEFISIAPSENITSSAISAHQIQLVSEIYKYRTVDYNFVPRIALTRIAENFAKLY